MDAIHIKRI